MSVGAVGMKSYSNVWKCAAYAMHDEMRQAFADVIRTTDPAWHVVRAGYGLPLVEMLLSFCTALSAFIASSTFDRAPFPAGSTPFS